jgi:hypothetical protein
VLLLRKGRTRDARTPTAPDGGWGCCGRGWTDSFWFRVPCPGRARWRAVSRGSAFALTRSTDEMPNPALPWKMGHSAMPAKVKKGKGGGNYAIPYSWPAPGRSTNQPTFTAVAGKDAR